MKRNWRTQTRTWRWLKWNQCLQSVSIDKVKTKKNEQMKLMMNLVGSSTQNRMHLDHQALPSPHSCPSSTPSWSSWPPSSFAFRTTVHVQPDHQALPLLRSCPCSTPSLTAALSPSCPSHQSTGFRLTQVVWEKCLLIMELFMDFLFPCFNCFACKGLSHRNLLGDDMTDCSFIFLYILCTMSIR